MNPTPNIGSSAAAKQAARQCLVVADKFIKESKFQEARVEIEKARKLDPTNVYVGAFLDRLNFFEQEKKKNSPSPPIPATTPVKSAPVAPAAPAAPLQTSPVPPKPAAVKPLQATPVPKTPIETKPVEVKPIVEKPNVPPPVPQEPKPIAETIIPPQKSAPSTSPVETTLEEMRKQIEMLTRALEQEKRAREEMSEQQMKANAAQLEAAMEQAWENGAPAEQDAASLHQMAISLRIPENIEHSIQREVKLKTYGQAVKEVVAKRSLLRSSSQTLEWLRKVYQVSLQEYLEYESKFLLDLVADQYKGTVLYVYADADTKEKLVPRLKSAGYAVVLSATPEEALEKIEKVNPNLIMCHMEFGPGSLSGIKFLQLIRATAKFNFIPFIFFCTENDVPVLQSSELRKNEGYVKVPIDFDELYSVMNEKLVQFREYISNLS